MRRVENGNLATNLRRGLAAGVLAVATTGAAVQAAPSEAKIILNGSGDKCTDLDFKQAVTLRTDAMKMSTTGSYAVYAILPRGARTNLKNRAAAALYARSMGRDGTGAILPLTEKTNFEAGKFEGCVWTDGKAQVSIPAKGLLRTLGKTTNHPTAKSLFREQTWDGQGPGTHEANWPVIVNSNTWQVVTAEFGVYGVGASIGRKVVCLSTCMGGIEYTETQEPGRYFPEFIMKNVSPGELEPDTYQATFSYTGAGYSSKIIANVVQVTLP